MTNDEIEKRIKEMKSEIFPLDLILPRETVFRIFFDIYSKENKKADFFKKRIYQRLREGYWGLFACKALDIMEKKEHYLVFPSNPDNDINFISNINSMSDKMAALIFDVKEFTKYSNDFENFVKTKVDPFRSLYGIIIGLHENVEGKSLKSLLNHDQEDRGVFVISAVSENNLNFYKSHVIYILRGEVLFRDVVSIEENINIQKPIQVYQNILKYKNK
jgi:hypothetical protein